MLDLYICSFVIFQGIRTSIALETLYFLFFSTGGGGSRSIVKNVFDCRLSGVETIWLLYIGGKFKMSVNRNYGFN